MPCEAIHCWSFITLVGAFLDLALAYLLLCGASLAFFTAKFLSIFGLRLPCSCHGGLFGNPNGGRGRCLQGLLVEGAPARIASIRASEKSRFPFVSSESHCFDVRLVRDGMNEGSSSGNPSSSSSSSSSSSAIRESERRVVSNLGGSEPDLNEGKWNVESRRQRSGVRRRRRGVVSGNGKVSSFSSSDAHQLLLEGSVGSAHSVREAGKGVSEEMPGGLGFHLEEIKIHASRSCDLLDDILYLMKKWNFY
ncbi:hypothetical protein QJS04_geneDACA004444 [Acorus gramineus]|uniref:Uncharacterized protein n=1 Tax=Acorus gramineus TaxID=55184 RepID=A0AAV9B2I1_ACOGR|nr:hypothetical protein QJS04_geneDACA004444 [Acorus gramineus]